LQLKDRLVFLAAAGAQANAARLRFVLVSPWRSSHQNAAASPNREIKNDLAILPWWRMFTAEEIGENPTRVFESEN